MSFNFFLSTLILNILFLLSFNSISNRFNLYDLPDNLRKIHKKKNIFDRWIFILFFLFNIFFIIYDWEY